MFLTDEQVERVVDSALESLLFSEPIYDEAHDHYGEAFDAVYGICDASPDLRASIEREVRDFFEACCTDGVLMDAVSAYENALADNYDWLEMFGHDMILTRNHHGAGFWDRGDDEQQSFTTLTNWAYGLGTLSIFEVDSDMFDAQ